jgi:hypothetical protein
MLQSFPAQTRVVVIGDGMVLTCLENYDQLN